VSGQASAQPTRPGATAYVPGVRIARLARQIGADGEKGDPLDDDILYDILRVEVTRVNSGASQYSITFNNWYLSTRKDRDLKEQGTDQPDRFSRLSARETLDNRGNPSWPRFKYNDFALLKFGDRLRIDMRYWPDPAPGLEVAISSAQNWVPMITGPITDMRFSFATGQGAQLTISGEDDLSVLKDKQEKRVPMDRLAEVNIVKQALSKAEYPLKSIARPTVAYPQFATDDSQGLQEALHSGQSYLDFIQKLAERLDFEVFVEFADLTKTDSPLEFHFEPYRGSAKPNDSLRDVFRLDRERNLLEFNPTIKVVDQYSEVEVRGRHRDPQIAKEVRGKATREIVADELHGDPTLDGALKTGPEIRETFFPGRRNKYTVQNQSNVDEARADWYAKAVIRKKARELFTIQGAAVGQPWLRPGNHVEIRGMRPPFDGFYYLTSTTHTFGSDGLRTRFSASRPGMELPGITGAPAGASGSSR
jgi:hypothetical protein